jgi:hypothetical protein
VALALAEEVGDGSMIAKLGQVHQNLELSAKVNGVLGAGSTIINNNLFVLPDYIELRAAITRALAGHPQGAPARSATPRRPLGDPTRSRGWRRRGWRRPERRRSRCDGLGHPLALAPGAAAAGESHSSLTPTFLD